MRLIVAGNERPEVSEVRPAPVKPPEQEAPPAVEAVPVPPVSPPRPSQGVEVLFVVSAGGAPAGSPRHTLLQGAVEKGLKLAWTDVAVQELKAPFNPETILSADAAWIVVCGDEVAEATGFTAEDMEEGYVTLPRGQRLVVTCGLDEVVSDPGRKRVFWNSLKVILGAGAHG